MAGKAESSLLFDIGGIIIKVFAVEMPLLVDNKRED